MAPGGYSLSHSLIWAVSGLSLISGKGPHAETCSYPSSGAPAAPGNQPSPRDKNRNKTLPDSKPQWGVTLPQGGRFSALPWQGWLERHVMRTT